MNFLITGGCGFIGSNFINIMAKKYPEYNFINLDSLHYCSDINNIEISTNYTFINDYLQIANLLNILEKYQINYVVHFAAQTHVDNSFINPIECLSDNIIGSFYLLDACRKYNKLIKYIHISTDEVYGDYQIDDNTELSRLEPTNPYSASKVGAEAITMAYFHTFKVPIIITRGNNVYGRNQYPEKIIPKFIKLLSNNQKCTIHGSSPISRTFIYVDDVISALDTILQKGQIGEIYNIGSYDRLNILDLTKTLIYKIKKTNDFDKWIEYIPDRLYNDKQYNINFDKIMKLGWKPLTPFEIGIDQTINWYINLFN